MSIILRHISKSYGAQEVLHDVSFEVHPGEIVSFLGPNGAGKSTCMKVITGWLTPDTGEVSICGQPLATHSLEAKRCMGYLPENNPLYPEMYVREYLTYVGNLYRLTNLPERVSQMMETMKLNEVRCKNIGTLSKGYRQRVGLAQALLHNPPVLILDEPSSGLDPNQLSEIHTLIREVGQDKAILFSSHSLQEVTELCQRTLIINHGRIVCDAPTADLTQNRPLEELFKELTQ